jgi:hypothetical protein
LMLAPSAAQAQCGHYVIVGAGSMSDPQAAHVQSLSEDNFPSGMLSPHVPLSPYKPCSGPGCKQRPQTPPLAPVAPPPVQEQEWGHLAWFSLPPAPGLADFLRDISCERPLDRAHTIYHPPRFCVA